MAGCASTEPESAVEAAPIANVDPTLVDATDPNTVMELARGFGAANLDVDAEGDPMIIGRINGSRYVIYFYGCEEGQSCREIQFIAAWADTGATVDDMNLWNQETRYGKAYLDQDGDPTLEHTVNLFKGVSRPNLDDTIDWWKVAMAAFEERLQ
ncbi:YbjN domain-containing protein [Marinobacter hydrocarbonoclasticus]|nr:YbjN domain-containing protein [Marinobacter nauticus]